MDLNFSKEEVAFRDEVRTFFKDHVPPSTRQKLQEGRHLSKQDMIISGGFNVYPQMIEQAMYEHPAVHEVIVIGIPDDYRGEAAKAFVKLRAGAAPFGLDELKAFLAGKLGKHEIPAALEFVDELPRTSVGKLSRHELRNLQQVAPKQQQLASGGRA